MSSVRAALKRQRSPSFLSQIMHQLPGCAAPLNMTKGRKASANYSMEGRRWPELPGLHAHVVTAKNESRRTQLRVPQPTFVQEPLSAPAQDKTGGRVSWAPPNTLFPAPFGSRAEAAHDVIFLLCHITRTLRRESASGPRSH